MLAERYANDRLAEILIRREAYHPFPTADERAGWEALPAALREHAITQGEEYLDFAWPLLPAVRFLDFARDGNRSRFEQLYHSRRAALASLVVAECLEGKGRFLDDIINGIWCICEESSWVVPAHTYLYRDGRKPLPDVTEEIIDLFAGETAGLLAWTHYLLRGPLDAQTELVSARIRHEITHRTLNPYLARDDFWWMTFHSKGQHVNNWNPWCNSNCLTAFLLLEEDADRRTQAVAKSMRSLDLFLASYHPDGGCDEGPGYWNRAGGSLFDCLEQYYWASDGRINVYGESLVQEMGRYIHRAHISGPWFIDFADGNAKMGIAADLVYRYGRRIGDDKLAAFGASQFWSKQAAFGSSQFSPKPAKDSLLRVLPSLFDYEEITNAPHDTPYLRDVWLPGLQVMAAREQDGSDSGLYLAAKGGHNNESHNHNDVGSFIVYVDGRPALIDLGVESYTAKTFSDHRYEIWTMQSAFHNLPTVNGVQQMPGKEAKAADVSYRMDDAAVEFALDIAGAYPPEAGIAAWRRICRLLRAEGRVEIDDAFRLTAPSGDIRLSLMTPCEPSITAPGTLLLRDAEGRQVQVAYDAAALAPTIERHPITDPRLTGSWGDHVYRILLTATTPTAEAAWQLRVSR